MDQTDSSVILKANALLGLNKYDLAIKILQERNMLLKIEDIKIKKREIE